jgi:hypothetical protein
MSYQIIEGESSPVTKQPIKYKQLPSGVFYTADTPDDLIEILEKLRLSHRRVKFCFGDRSTGKDWEEEHDIYGRIGNSTGTIKIPLLIFNNRSFGGGALLTSCIVKITESTRPYEVIYEHPNYHRGESI